jgi:hypothetical protein
MERVGSLKCANMVTQATFSGPDGSTIVENEFMVCPSL